LKSFPSRGLFAAAAILSVALGLRAELTRWAEDVTAGSRLDSVFFRTVLLPSGAVPVRRPPKETRPELTQLIAATPNDAELYSLRALEAEQQLDFPAAEADWGRYVEAASDKGAARLAMADFYHRRLRPSDEFGALVLAAGESTPDSEKLLPAAQQRPWKTYERMVQLADDQRLNPQLVRQQFGAWIQRFPAQPVLYRRFLAWAIDHQVYEAAGGLIAEYQRAFPDDEEFPVEARAEVTAKTGPAAQALEVYERSFRPLWPQALVKKYFELLKQTGSLRAYLERARTAVTANPTDLSGAARLFYYWQQQGNPASAGRALTEFRQRKDARRSAWTSEELLTLARLSESLPDYDEAARNYYALYSQAGANDAMAETALGSLARLMLAAPEQPIHFGSGNLSLYRDVAAMDPHPGFLNGVLSLLLNEADPPNRAAVEEQNAGAYFRRERAAELVSLFESRFPNSAARPELRERVIEAYGIYGSSDGVIRAGVKFLADFPNAPNRTSVALRLAGADARTNQTPLEFAIYDSVLAELGKQSGGVPLGAFPQTGAPVQPGTEAQPRSESTPRPNGDQDGAVRSPEYARVLDRYVARLVSMKRVPDALALYRREIDRNPNDPGLYDVLAAFLEQNRLGVETEQTFERAIAQFQDHSWQSKLARWYLQQRRQADLNRLTRQVVGIFTGTELDAYFSEMIGRAAPVGPALYLQLNLFAHQRFPHHLSFVRNLLTAYTATATRDDAAYEALLRRHWYDAEDLRMRFFERLSRSGRLGTELSTVRTANPAAIAGRWSEAADQSPAAARILAEGEAWRGHFETAAPMFLAIETNYPADATLGRRTGAMYRSLGTIDARFTDAAIAVEEKLSQANPLDQGAVTSLGEIEAGRERMERARAHWNQLAEIEPAKPAGYLEAATVFWDYYQYDDALRLIELGRQRLTQPSLFAYEAGVIRENQRDYERAILEYAKGALAQPDSNAQRRLLALGRRPAFRARVEQLTTGLTASNNPDMGAFRLRMALLRGQARRDDLEQFLLAVATRTSVPELLTTIQDTGRVDGYPKVQQAALERRIAVSTDPVERMQLRITLARFLEGQGNATQGLQVIDALYRENPAILGVVRAAVDAHWRNRDTKRAVDILEETAGRAEAGYRMQFVVEATRKSTEAGDYARARGFAAKLLDAEPLRAEYIAAMADTYARQGDNNRLRAFYAAKIQAIATASIAPADRIAQTAEMRRALIPVLTRLRDFSAGVDQYVEILNRYPEDETLVREAALYASSNGMAARLHDYYVKASSDSPKDFRWPMVLARIETQREDFPAAIASYTRAMSVRPDRADLLSARLNLEERLLRFDEAAVSAEKLYELTYHNSQWMEKLAELRARQGQTAAAVAALNRAWIEGRSANAHNYAHVAEQLESWKMLAEARRFEEEALKRDPAEGLVLYARILTRQREYETAFARLTGLKTEVATPVAREIGITVANYYSPDEKAKFAAALAARPLRIVVAQAAGLGDLEALWLYQRILANPAAARAEADKQRLIEQQRARLRFDELGGQLEAFDRAEPPGTDHGNELEEAAGAYRSSGSTNAELRVLQRMHGRGLLEGPLLERYSRQLLGQPQRMVTAIRNEAQAATANAMLNYIEQHASAAVAQQAIEARGTATGPLWTKAYTGLSGLYNASSSATVRAAFTGILGDMTIGARIGKALDRDQQLAGDPWFYYGGRYGEYLAATKQPGAADYIPALVEASPARSEGYFTEAEYFRESGDSGEAVLDYRSALELNPSRADAHDRLAMIAAKEGRRDQAIQEWKLAIAAFARIMDGSRVPARFWNDLSDTVRHIGEAKALDAERDDVDKLLRTYIRRNGSFEVDSLLQAALAASADEEAGIRWIAELSRSAADPVQFLGALIGRPWIPEAQEEILYASVAGSAQARVSQTFGDEQQSAQNQLLSWQISWAQYLLDRRENDRARQLLATFPADSRKQRPDDVISLEVRLAARTGGLAAQLASYAEPPPLDRLRNVATKLRKQGDAASSRRVLEFVYEHQIRNGIFDVSNFLGLAEIRLAERDTPGAVALLRRMTLVAGDGFAPFDAAAALLEKTGHEAEAAEFLTALTRAEPWNADAQRRLATVQTSPAALSSVAKSSGAPYTVRTDAALALRKLKGPALTDTDGELMLLSSQTPLAETDVAKPYYAAARLQAAAESANAAVRERLLLAAIAIDPKPAAPKLDLFRAALESRHDARAIAVAGQLLPRYPQEQDTFEPWMAESFLGDLTEADRVAVARGLGEANQRQGEVRLAAWYYRVAQRLAADPRILRALETVEAQAALAVKNETRRPVFTDNPDQDRLVRPRLTAASAAGVTAP